MSEHPRRIFRVDGSIRNFANRILYLGLIGSAVVLIFLGKADIFIIERIRAKVTDAVAPILDFTSRPISSVRELMINFQDHIDLKSKYSQLLFERNKLLQWQFVAERLEAENKSLKNLLKFKKGPESSFISARIIADTGGAFAHSVVLNVGDRDGVKNGQAVVSGLGLVGRIAIIGDRSTRVLLITDLNSRIPVLIEKTRIRGILAGNNSDKPKLIHLPSNTRVTRGARIITSGHAGLFPPGIPIGVVSSKGETGVTIKPYVERSTLEYITIIKHDTLGLLVEQSLENKRGVVPGKTP